MWTYPPKRIVAAVDFGDASDRALRVAGELARRFDASVTAVHAETFEAPPYFTREQVRAIEEQRRAARKKGLRYLTRHATELVGGAVEAIVSDSPPANAIIDAGRDRDLIVMGTHGRRGPARWWAGSVAERVARDARVPVLVVRAGECRPEELFRSIAVIARRGTFDGAARRYAKGLADTFGGAYSRESATSLQAARIQDATLVVVAQPGAGASAVIANAADRIVRSCERPVLFVPST